MPKNFEAGKSYPIETLPDDLYDDDIANAEKWAIRDVLFWNDCQGWWHEHVADYWRGHSLGEPHLARYWSPEPDSPMTREEICKERGWKICGHCDVAYNEKSQEACVYHETARCQRTEER